MAKWWELVDLMCVGDQPWVFCIYSHFRKKWTTSPWDWWATQFADGWDKWLCWFGACVLLAGSPLSDEGNFGRARGKEKACSEISLEICSQLTTISASGTSQLRVYINFSNSPWWTFLSWRHLIAFLTPMDFWQMQYLVVMSSPI